MKFKESLKNFFRRLAGDPIPKEVAVVNVYKNKKSVFTFSTENKETVRQNLCDLLMFFQKFNKYQIVCNFVDREFNIYFSTTPANDVDADEVEKKIKK
ncbi:MAG: hypothetical protein MJ066_05365 [Clostridia bacterium]|nr:hypothetical protein [Clostridia bacterium]